MILTARWVVPVSSPPLFQHAVEIEQDRIVRIRPVRPDDPPPVDTCLMPGLVNTHTHLAYTAFRNSLDHLTFFPWIRQLTQLKYTILTESDVISSTRLGIYECIKGGITTIADMSDLEPSLATLARSPLRGNFYWEIFGVEKDAAEQTWNGLDSQFERLKSEYSTDRLQIGISPHACYTVRPELYKKVANWARKKNVPLSFHASESAEEEEFIAGRKGPIADFLRDRASDWRIDGKSSIEYLESTGVLATQPLIAHAVQASLTDLDLLRKNGVRVAHCPKSNSKFGHGIAPVAEMLNAGIDVGIGSDSAASNNRLDLFEEGRIALLQQRLRYRQPVLSESKILEMLTIGGAKAMGMERQIGSIEPGKVADLILIRIPSYYQRGEQVVNHLIHNTSAPDVLKTFIGGVSVEVSEPDVSEVYRKLSSL